MALTRARETDLWFRQKPRDCALVRPVGGKLGLPEENWRRLELSGLADAGGSRHRDGAGLRRLGLCQERPPDFVASSGSRWKVILDTALSRDEAGEKTAPEIFERIRRLEPPGTAGPRAEIVRSRLEWTYPAAYALGRAAKVSVTELKRRFDPLVGEEEPLMADFRKPVGGRPLFLQEKRGLSAAEAGTALHLVLQNLDLAGDTGAASIAEQVEGWWNASF